MCNPLNKLITADDIQTKWCEKETNKLIEFDDTKNKYKEFGIYKVVYNPGRENRLVPQNTEKSTEKNTPTNAFPGSSNAFPGNLQNHPGFIYHFEDENMDLLANKFPIEKYHCLAFSDEYLAQNALAINEIKNVSNLVQKLEFGAFINMSKGGGASQPRWHAQIWFSSFLIEKLKPVKTAPNLYHLEGYPGGHILIQGTLEERISLLKKIIKNYRDTWETNTIIRYDLGEDIVKNYKEKFPKADIISRIQKLEVEIEGDKTYNLIMWKDNILFVPRRRETPNKTKTNAKAAGLELSGTWIVTDREVYDHIQGEDYITTAIEEVTFPQEEIDKFLEKTFSEKP